MPLCAQLALCNVPRGLNKANVTLDHKEFTSLWTFPPKALLLSAADPDAKVVAPAEWKGRSRQSWVS